MIGRLVWHNTLHRPLRTILSVIAVGVEVALILLVVGLTHGMLHEVGKRIEGVGADIMVQPPSSSVFLAFSGAPMPQSLAGRLSKLPNVAAVAPVLLQMSSSGGLDIVYGIDPASFRAVSDGFVYLQGHGLEKPDDVLVDDLYAHSKHIRVGDTLQLFGHDFHVAGVVEHGKGARVFLPLQTLQQISGSPNEASLFFIKCTGRGLTGVVAKEIRNLLPGYEVRPLQDYLSLMTPTRVPGLNTFVHSMITLAAAIGFLVIFLSMYMTIIERTREIGVLKSLGASNIYIVQALMGETMLVCGAGIVAGLLLGYGGRLLILGFFPTLSVLISPGWILRAAAMAIAAGMAGTSYPAWLAVRKDPVEALAYE
ncbi:MAG TPA: FtsX-like permease family protein [Candidatus Dormibacteraeota bacterium]|nr:FtsX-like permease family protein [Candidatus Dormibacteraeota bacterium]